MCVWPTCTGAYSCWWGLLTAPVLSSRSRRNLLLHRNRHRWAVRSSSAASLSGTPLIVFLFFPPSLHLSLFSRNLLFLLSTAPVSMLPLCPSSNLPCSLHVSRWLPATSPSTLTYHMLSVSRLESFISHEQFECRSVASSSGCGNTLSSSRALAISDSSSSSNRVLPILLFSSSDLLLTLPLNPSFSSASALTSIDPHTYAAFDLHVAPASRITQATSSQSVSSSCAPGHAPPVRLPLARSVLVRRARVLRVRCCGGVVIKFASVPDWWCSSYCTTPPHITRHTSHVICHTLHVTHHIRSGQRLQCHQQVIVVFVEKGGGGGIEECVSQ
jgi:hypothetical protein